MATFNCFLQGVVSHLLYLSCTFFHGLRLRKWEDSLRKKKGEKNVEKIEKKQDLKKKLKWRYERKMNKEKKARKC